MATRSGPYKRILVPVDGSRTSTRGLKEALRLAKACGAKLRLIHVVDTMIAARGAALDYNAADLIDVLAEQGGKTLAQAKAAAGKARVRCETAQFESNAGRVADSIVREARRWRADLIVMGTHGRRGFSHLVLGSDAELVVRSSPVPVLLVRAPQVAKRGARSGR